ncbi:MAG: LysM peptidoglycan-binding domain-containing protein [Lentisphaerae bacterium]|jgi:nucleoid-associated protein YgaU|nr:LysM peptidoglycan-binding domain-containing protein [Lentisphaerota bacterium]HQL08079.1 LysM peptidoglycan-binding domain-containing protein [Lentisphaeria bacterium]
MGIFTYYVLPVASLAAFLATQSVSLAGDATTGRLYAQAGRSTVVVNDATRIQRDVAAMQADMRVLQEDQKMLLARIMGLEQEIQNRDERIKELQNLLTATDNRFEALDREWRQRFDALNAALEQERASRSQEIQAVGKAMAAEIVRVEKSAAAAAKPSAPAAYSGKYKELVVQKGDTLSGISSLAGVSIESIREANGLKSDVIRVGQVLKIPTK